MKEQIVSIIMAELEKFPYANIELMADQIIAAIAQPDNDVEAIIYEWVLTQIELDTLGQYADDIGLESLAASLTAHWLTHPERRTSDTMQKSQGRPKELEVVQLCYLCHEPLTAIEAGAHDWCLGKLGDGL